MRQFFDYLHLTLLQFFNITSKNKIRLAGYTIHYGNIKYLKLLYKEIFIKENYKCQLSNEPYIIDGGANIGMAILYLKKQYPKATIKAFEPDQESFDLLKKNIETNHIDNVELFNAALSDTNGTIKFYLTTGMLEGDVRGSAVLEQINTHLKSSEELQEVTIPSKKVSDFIEEKVDLLKIDIEGSEGKVLKEIDKKFSLIENSIMEYHYQSDNSENKLSGILQIIENNNHEYVISKIDKSQDIKSNNCYMIKSKLVENS